MSIHVRLRLGAEEYALPVEHVSEVVEVGSLTAVPGAPPSVLGIRNLRGRILPVYDLAAVLEVEAPGRRDRVVVADCAAGPVGLAVDGVTDVAELPPPAEETRSELLVGAVLFDDSLVGVVDLPRLLGRLVNGVGS